MLVLIKNILQYKELLGACVFCFVVLTFTFKDTKAVLNVLVKFTTVYAIAMLVFSLFK